ncbi:unnamed protein product [Rotaria socialis]|uniref:HTH OST-type domain-containing protein n=1 Tax=Rotaria socialis TaxID=392032 RepID=A0A820PW30_9BILA|nr:unnamed protein product [Rotaria socialis]
MASSSSTSYDSVKQEIYQLYASSLIPSIDAGLTLTEFCREYERRYNHGPIPYHDLGYETLSRFLGSMKDIILMNYKEWPTRCYLNENGDVNQRTEKIRVRTGTETYDEVKNNIYSILTSSISIKYGLSFTELCQQYSSENDGRQLPFAQLGYATLTDLLKTMWDVGEINYQVAVDYCEGFFKKSDVFRSHPYTDSSDIQWENYYKKTISLDAHDSSNFAFNLLSSTYWSLLVEIFNHSLTEGIMSEKWKDSRKLFLAKKGFIYGPAAAHPISLLDVFLKVNENLFQIRFINTLGRNQEYYCLSHKFQT